MNWTNGLPKDRLAAAVVGGALATATFGVIVLTPVTPASSAVEVIFALGAVALLLYAVIYDRLKSVGPTGVELFKRRTVGDRTVEVVAHRASGAEPSPARVPRRSVEARAGAAMAHGQAGAADVTVEEAADAAVKAGSPEEFADRLVALTQLVAGARWPNVQLDSEATGPSMWVPRDSQLGEPNPPDVTYAIEVLRPSAGGALIGVQVSRMAEGRLIDSQVYDAALASSPAQP